MRLRQLKIGKCRVNVEPSNDIKPHVKVDGDTLHVIPRCRCGESLGEFDIADRTNLIVERALVEKEAAKKSGKRLLIEMGDFASIDTSCSKCGREVHVSVHFVLSKKWLKDLNRARKHAKESMLYGGCLEVSAEIKGGHFAKTRDMRTVAELLNPLCACGVELKSMKARGAFERIIRQISEFWEKGVPVESISIEDKVKCTYCLYTAKIKVAFTPKLPTKNSTIPETVQKYQQWQKRMLT